MVATEPTKGESGRGRGRPHRSERGESNRGRGGRDKKSSRGESARKADASSRPRSDFKNGNGEKPSVLVKQEQESELAEDENAVHCFICTEPIAIFAVGECNHRTCHLCSLRLRALYKTRHCAYCKSEIHTAYFTNDPSKLYQDYTAKDLLYMDERLGIKFENRQMFQDSMILLQFNCPKGDCDVACEGGWQELKRHVKKAHGMLLCDLCIKHKKIFAHEQTLFTPDQLQKHYKYGDSADSEAEASGFKGHPECAFCGISFYGDDELYEHCRDKHEQCHVCVRQGIRHQYYANYDSLAKHFRKDHYMCQYPECLEKKFVVFPSDIDLKAHEVEVHGASMTGLQRARRNEARKVDIAFQYASAHTQRDREPSKRTSRDRNVQDTSRAGTSSSTPDASSVTSSLSQTHLDGQPPAQRVSNQNNGQRVPQTTEDFPAMSNAPTPKRGIAARAPKGFGALTPSAPTTSTSSSSTSAKPSSTADPATMQRHSALLERVGNYLGRDEERVERFRQLTTAYRRSILKGETYLDSLTTLLGNNMDITGKIVSGVAELLEDDAQRTELLKLWNDKKAATQSFPSLTPITDDTSTNPRVLVIKAGSTRAGGTRTTTNVWDRVNRAANNAFPALGRSNSPIPGSASPVRSASPVAFPSLGTKVGAQVGLAPSGTAWAGSVRNQNVSSSTSRPQFVGAGSTPTAPIGTKRGSSGADFPSLPMAPKRDLTEFGIRRKSSGHDAWGLKKNANESASEAESVENLQESPKGKKGKKQKQLLFHVGL
ncbi:hypothetical protein BZG36_02291 [Bifiguratus adelaidae]|uniref:RING-type E3 ubiquitin transferase n=1 Tax=Bifiguratus adelaidae TaxID=1938954 RepID=A0A261Y3N5_9FUNG|nr:hypothetical protein BZG36_02291 [Bifiguratus adelaidae]